MGIRQDKRGVRLGSKGRGRKDESRLVGGREWTWQVLFRTECVDEVAVQALLQQHPGRVAREVEAGGRREVGRVVLRLCYVEWGGLEAENQELRARIDAMEKKEGVQGGQSIPSREGKYSEDVWRECMHGRRG